MLGPLTTLLARIVLQTTTDYRDLWTSGNWFDAVVQPFLDLAGPVFPLAVGLTIGGMLFIYSGSLGLPTVVMVLVGGAMIPFLPAAAQVGAVLLILFGVATGLYSAWMSGGTRL